MFELPIVDLDQLTARRTNLQLFDPPKDLKCDKSILLSLQYRELPGEFVTWESLNHSCSMFILFHDQA